MSETPAQFEVAPPSIPEMPVVDTPRDDDGVLQRGTVLMIGIMPHVAMGSFFVSPPGKVRRGGGRGGKTFPFTRQGWMQAWAEFEAGDPLAAANYRQQDALRQANLAKAQERLAQEEERRAVREAPARAIQAMRDAAFAVVPGCSMVNGYGTQGLAQAQVTLVFALDRIEILSNADKPLLSIPLDQVLTVQVDGPGAVTTGGGFIGGGVALTGAVEGSLMAAALNALTRKTTVQTFLEVHAPGRHMLWVTDRATPQQLQTLLRPIQARLRELRIQRDQGRLAEPLDRLAKLGSLRESGVLSEVEFVTVKAAILADMA